MNNEGGERERRERREMGEGVKNKLMSCIKMKMT